MNRQQTTTKDDEIRDMKKHTQRAGLLDLQLPVTFPHQDLN